MKVLGVFVIAAVLAAGAFAITRSAIPTDGATMHELQADLAAARSTAENGGATVTVSVANGVTVITTRDALGRSASDTLSKLATIASATTGTISISADGTATSTFGVSPLGVTVGQKTATLYLSPLYLNTTAR